VHTYIHYIYITLHTIRMYIHTYMHTHIHTCIHLYIHTMHTYIHYIYITLPYIPYVCTYIHTYTHTYMNTLHSIHACTHICMHTFIHIYITLHYIPYTHTHTHTHMCVPVYHTQFVPENVNRTGHPFAVSQKCCWLNHFASYTRLLFYTPIFYTFFSLKSLAIVYHYLIYTLSFLV